MTPDEKFGRSVQEARESRGWSMSRLATKLDEAGLGNFHAATIGRMERAQRPVRLSEAVVIADVLDTPLEDLLGGPGEEQRVAGRVVEALRYEDARRGDLGHAVDAWLHAQVLVRHELDEADRFGVERVAASVADFPEAVAAARRVAGMEVSAVIDEQLSPIGEGLEEYEKRMGHDEPDLMY